jgi:hypothetical protein
MHGAQVAHHMKVILARQLRNLAAAHGQRHGRR